MRFYSIFVPGTTPYLHAGPLSLAHHEPRIEPVLVSNGLTDIEFMSLANFASRAGFDIFDLATPRPLPHGIALNLLFAQHRRSLPFAFIDNDIYATGAWLTPLLEKYDTDGWACTGLRIEDRTEVTYRGFWGGSALVSDDEKPLCTTYLSIVDPALVIELMTKYQLGFESTVRRSQLSPATRALVESSTVADNRFDTGKLLSYVAAKERGIESFYIPSPSLHHIGGLSTAITRRKQARALQSPNAIFHLAADLFDTTVEKMSNRRSDVDIARKQALAGYFAEWTLAAVDGSPFPTRQALPEPWESRVSTATSAMRGALNKLTESSRPE